MVPGDTGTSAEDLKTAQRMARSTKVKYSASRDTRDVGLVRREGQEYAEALESAGIRTGGNLEGALQDTAETIQSEEALMGTVAGMTAAGEVLAEAQWSATGRAAEHTARIGAAMFDRFMFANANDIMGDLFRDADVWNAMIRRKDLIRETFDTGLRASKDMIQGNYVSGMGRSVWTAGAAAGVAGLAAADLTWNSYDDSSLGT